LKKGSGFDRKSEKAPFLGGDPGGKKDICRPRTDTQGGDKGAFFHWPDPVCGFLNSGGGGCGGAGGGGGGGGGCGGGGVVGGGWGGGGGGGRVGGVGGGDPGPRQSGTNNQKKFSSGGFKKNGTIPLHGRTPATHFR